MIGLAITYQEKKSIFVGTLRVPTPRYKNTIFVCSASIHPSGPQFSLGVFSSVIYESLLHCNSCILIVIFFENE